MQYLGMGKTKYNSGIYFLENDDNFLDGELLLTERLTRKKNSGLWPSVALKNLEKRITRESIKIAENRDVHFPNEIEDIQNQLFPFYEHLQKQNLDFFLSKFNPKINYVSHHEAHAFAALAMSPFDQALILVMDGAGTRVGENLYEECTAFLMDGPKLKKIFERQVSFYPAKNNKSQTFGNRTGTLYEKVSEYIFNSPHSSGKVMGLAAYADHEAVEDIIKFQESLNWENAFKGKDKKSWEKLDHNYFIKLAAQVQKTLEKDYWSILADLKRKYPSYNNLILTGGCALNCTNNAKILKSGLYDKIYVPAFPGDECIGLGVASALYYGDYPEKFKPLEFKKQKAYLGQKTDSLSLDQLRKVFPSDKYSILECDVVEVASDLIKDFKVIAWFQGRSEVGPRALGNRSILARPDFKDLKNYLNENIKFREAFRPYGASVLHSEAMNYFVVPNDFYNPYMSYALEVKTSWKELLKEVTHVDGTCRMQTVTHFQNEKFFQLLEKTKLKTGHGILLNTSLNIMDEPILESYKDAELFFKDSRVDALVIENYLIKKINELKK